MLLFTNKKEFYNDLCEVIRLFLSPPAIELAEGELCASDGTALCVFRLEDALGSICAQADFFMDGRRFSHSHSLPPSTALEGEGPLALALEEKRLTKRSMKIAAFRALRLAFPDARLPWGSLTGIRPTRLLRDLCDRHGAAEAERMFLEEFDVTREKLALASEIVRTQRPVLDSAKPDDVDVYIGIPFCKTRCLYCSFASELRTKGTDMAAYLAALERDIALGAALVRERGRRVRSVYIGGGTPTVLSAAELDGLLSFAANEYDLSGCAEITVEAGRPDTSTPEKLRVLKKNGVTRISINPQTMNDKTLALVGRSHTAEDIGRCFYTAREIGFDSINMDLIAGLPGEDAADMARTCEDVAALAPDCLTVHTLAIKRSSRLHEKLESYRLPEVSEVEKMTELGESCARSMGMRPYYMYRQKYMAGNMQNVGYARDGKLCIYNIDMMEDSLSIIAHGAGAMNKRVMTGERRIERVPNPKDIATYIEKIEKTHAQRRLLWDEE